jgi:hypothetical protein
MLKGMYLLKKKISDVPFKIKKLISGKEKRK